ncbi:MAG: response regulator [Candidatus Omnitrophica bacterium]|nr:response regulator [Candidatus Omnitrophota bacterium]
MAFDRSKFIEQFKSETKEHIQKLSQGFLKLETRGGNKALLGLLMREAHTIKGSATMMGYKRISEIAHKIEDGFDKAMKKKVTVRNWDFDTLFKCVDSIEALLEDKVTWEAKGIDRPFVEKLCGEIDKMFSGKAAGSKAKTALPARAVSLDVQEAKLDRSIRVNTDRLNKLINLSGELVVSKIRMNELVSNLIEKTDSERDRFAGIGDLTKDLKEVCGNIDVSAANIQTEIMNVRMVPVSHLFNVFPRAMRDLAHQKGKDIEFDVIGGDTELDKGILDEMKSPIMHLLRNSVDHGIESAKERKRAKKPRSGRISLKAYQKGSQVIIEVSDDGRGIDPVKVKEQAKAKGIVLPERIDEMIDAQIVQLIFSPGFSTKNNVSEVSGRGVGLDVVHEKAAALKGIVEVSSKVGEGTTFIIKLPLTLAVTESLLVAAGNETFAVPIDMIIETIRVAPKDIKTVETKEAITVKGHIIPLVRIGQLFDVAEKGIVERRFFSVIIVQFVEKKLALLVDGLIGRQEIVSKRLGAPLENVKNIAGATIVGNGKVVLILDVPSIIESAEGVVLRRPAARASLARSTKKKRKTILLAEDVLSTAMLEKNILESAGFSVVIARDGEEALRTASQEKFDLIITDVLMPKMNGFELTEKLKKDKFYRDVPVIIVTTRESDADKRRGLEAGADAYILKSEFTGEGLLDVIERMIG